MDRLAGILGIAGVAALFLYAVYIVIMVVMIGDANPNHAALEMAQPTMLALADAPLRL